MRKLLTSIPTVPLVVVVVLLGLAPFRPEPHLVEKLRMLWNGTLTRPIDIFDLVFHASPLVLLLLKFVFEKIKRN